MRESWVSHLAPSDGKKMTTEHDVERLTHLRRKDESQGPAENSDDRSLGLIAYCQERNTMQFTTMQ